MTNYSNLTFEGIIDSISSKYKFSKLLFHFTDISNAVIILNQQKLLSRTLVNSLDILQNDNASSTMIKETPTLIKDYVRLYFRPKTPTQYNNEGIKHNTKQEPYCSYPDAHCPIPIFFVFKSAEILSQSNTFFTKKGAYVTQDNELMSTPEEFASLPFEKIYHAEYFPTHLSYEEKTSIIKHRHAEVLVLNEMNLDYLVAIVCRSYPEKTYLLKLLNDVNPVLAEQYEPLIKVEAQRHNFFYKERSYLKDVIFNDKSLKIILNEHKHAIEPDVYVRVTGTRNDEVYHYPVDHSLNLINTEILFNLDFMKVYDPYRFEIYINGIKTYDEEYTFEIDLPF